MRKGGKGLVLAAAAFLGFSSALVMGQEGGSPIESLLATGSFVCSVQVVDPPGPGVPERFASVTVLGVLGLPVNNFLGGGGKLGNPTIEACDALAAAIVSLAENRVCTASDVVERSFVGSNFREESRSFDFVCEGGRNQVTATLADMMRAVMKDEGAAVGGLIRTDPRIANEPE